MGENTENHKRMASPELRYISENSTGHICLTNTSIDDKIKKKANWKTAGSKQTVKGKETYIHFSLFLYWYFTEVVCDCRQENIFSPLKSSLNKVNIPLYQCIV